MNIQNGVAGKIKRLWRYPVKSLLGESCRELSVNKRGVIGDRWFAIENNRGKFGSGKNTRRFCKIEGLFNFQAQYDGDILVVTFPDGRKIRGDNSLINQELSLALGQSVTLVSERHISHFDADSLHLLTTSSLRSLKSLLPQSTIDERRFRPNLLIDIPGEGLLEHDWIKKRLLIGKELEIEITGLTERCIMTCLQQEELTNDSRIIRSISKNFQHNFGVYAKIIKTGIIQLEDPVIIL
ncbi:MOSC domain-containing protein [Pleurocapsa sp. CCALA 161]|uniref:MOSC domain-containing protein n=1 Tax=Pleurocapsa sp. CCALA 161 TaxID=2107688 RepID=UPI000D07E93F|nr:MOSC N-terminal beta barrel domain-containing protein [Pleurocapsa sp. CCALA 161]PSB10758.1 MOSC domain-containing protein [Pleurocapsa sp. CCALA 161]